MGHCLSTASESPPEVAHSSRARSNAIDKQIEEDSRKFKKDCKILLLGSGESGKSTIVKQMKILHQNGFKQAELVAFTSVVHKNVCDSAQAVVLAMQEMPIHVPPNDKPRRSRKSKDKARSKSVSDVGDDDEEPETTEAESSSKAPTVSSTLLPATHEHEATIIGHHLSITGFTAEVGNAIQQWYADPGVKAFLSSDPRCGRDFYLMDSAEYFFSSIARISQSDYIPDVTDVLRARVKSTSITETRFQLGPLMIHMFDVGGQRSERRKWIHCFESVTSIIFCTALSEYDQVLLEEKSQNRLLESLVLFDSIINSRWFLRTSIILFLNKIDVLKAKLTRSPLEKYFPEYIGGKDINKAARYILWKFMQTNRARLSVYPHLTQATDTSNVKLVFAAVKETILQNSLKDSGIL